MLNNPVKCGVKIERKRRKRVEYTGEREGVRKRSLHGERRGDNRVLAIFTGLGQIGDGRRGVRLGQLSEDLPRDVREGKDGKRRG